MERETTQGGGSTGIIAYFFNLDRVGRTLVDGPADVSAVNELQDQYTLTPLSLWGENAKLAGETRRLEALRCGNLSAAEWKTMNRAMTEDPPEPRILQLVSLFGKVGVGPGQDVDKTDEATKRGLKRAALDGRKLLKDSIDSGALGNRSTTGRSHPAPARPCWTNDDFLLRASLQCLGGIVANWKNRRRLFTTTQPRTGPVSPSMAPNVTRCTSSLVNCRRSKPSGPLLCTTRRSTSARYAIGDRTQGLKKDADGGLTIYIQNDSPGDEKESNWLPSTTNGSFLMVMRTYSTGSRNR